MIKLKNIIFSAVVLAAVTVTAKEKSEAKVKHVKNVNGFSFSYEDCWDVRGTYSNDFSKEGQIDIYPAKSCEKAGAEAWEMGISSAGSYSNRDFINDEKKIYAEVFFENRNISKYDAILFAGIRPETDKLIDDKSQKNYHWVLKVKCKKMNAVLAYTEHLEKSRREEARKNPKIPPPFQFLIDHFSCE